MSIVTRYIICIKDPATLEVISTIAYKFSSVALARENLIDMIIRAKQLPCRLEIVLNSKWANDSGEETYSHIVVTYTKRGNEKVYYHINKVQVEESDAEIPEVAEIIETKRDETNPFDLMKGM